MIWPAWVYCTRYSDRPSAGPRAKRTRKKEGKVQILQSLTISLIKNRQQTVANSVSLILTTESVDRAFKDRGPFITGQFLIVQSL